METIEDLKKLLEYKETEIQKMKPVVDLYESLKDHEIKEIKRLMGSDWQDEYSTLPIPSLRKLAKVVKNRIR